MKRLILATIISSLIAPMSFAQDAQGKDGGNGGDACERRFIEIRDNMEDWIVQGGGHALDFSKAPTAMTEENYRVSMLEAIDSYKVSCVEEQQFIGHASKTCTNFIEDDGTKLVQCQTDRFLSTDEEEQYRLVHHEYAGAAEIETNDGDEESKYFLSNQIGASLEIVVSKRLVVKRHQSESSKLLSDSVLVSPRHHLVMDGDLVYLPKEIIVEVKENGFFKNKRIPVGWGIVSKEEVSKGTFTSNVNGNSISISKIQEIHFPGKVEKITVGTEKMLESKDISFIDIKRTETGDKVVLSQEYQVRRLLREDGKIIDRTVVIPANSVGELFKDERTSSIDVIFNSSHGEIKLLTYVRSSLARGYMFHTIGASAPNLYSDKVEFSLRGPDVLLKHIKINN